jgi:hypothetical protein
MWHLQPVSWESASPSRQCPNQAGDEREVTCTRHCAIFKHTIMIELVPTNLFETWYEAQNENHLTTQLLHQLTVLLSCSSSDPSSGISNDCTSQRDMAWRWSLQIDAVRHGAPNPWDLSSLVTESHHIIMAIYINLPTYVRDHYNLYQFIKNYPKKMTQSVQDWSHCAQLLRPAYTTSGRAESGCICQQ